MRLPCSLVETLIQCGAMDGLGPATAKGHLFVTLEDEEGLVSLIVRPDGYER